MAGLLIAATVTGGQVATDSAMAAGGPCATLAYPSASPPAYDHVVVVMDENLSYRAFQSSTQAPYLKSLVAGCGSEADMHAATHSSHPNYMAATSGTPTGIGVHTADDNVFAQATRAGDTWAVYVESMPLPCSPATRSAPTYATGHNPAFWYTGLAAHSSSCKADDVPLSPSLDVAVSTDSLPTFSWIVPNLCDDMHGASTCGWPSSERVSYGDDWLRSQLTALTVMPSYLAGHTLIIVTWDEGNGTATAGVDCTDPAYYPSHPDCQIPTIVVSPYVSRGAVDSSDHNLYGLLRTVEDAFGYAPLRRASSSSSLRSGMAF
jgi:phospholipase C